MSGSGNDDPELQLVELRGHFFAHVGAILDDESVRPMVRSLASNWVELERALDRVPVEQDLGITRRFVSRIERTATAPPELRANMLDEMSNDVADVKNIVLAAVFPGNPKAPYRPSKLTLPATEDVVAVAQALDLPDVLARIRDPYG